MVWMNAIPTAFQTTKKYVVVRNVLATEESKRKQAVGIHARDGIVKHLILIHTKLSIRILVWMKITAEIRMMNLQFGAKQQMNQRRGNFVIQFLY